MATEPLTTIRDHWLLAGLPPELVEPLVSHGQEERYLSGEIIFREGAPSTGLYFTLSGVLTVTGSNTEGETLLAVVRPNEIVGELGVLDGGPRSGTAQAISMCALYFMPTEPFLDLLERSSLVSMRLLGLLARRLRGADVRLVELRPATAAGAEPG